MTKIMTNTILPTAEDIQLRFISNASRKIIINTNANFQKGEERYSEELQLREAESLKQQIISEHEIVQRLKADIPNIKTLIHSITENSTKEDKIFSKRYEEELFAYLKSILENKII